MQLISVQNASTARRAVQLLGALLLLLRTGTLLAAWGDEPQPGELRAALTVSIAFASGDLRAPVSLFGHTFLVFHAGDTPAPDAPTVEFAGIPRSVRDHLRALTDRIDGHYALSYFSYKRRDYATEGRSLWIYPLRLSDHERARLVDEIARRLQRRWHYGFFRHNCAHYVLDVVAHAIGAERPGPERPHVTPESTLQVLASLGRLGDGRFMPSPRFVAAQQFLRLDTAQRARLDALLGGRADLVPDDEPVLRATVGAAAEAIALTEDRAAVRSHLLRLRAAAGTSSAQHESPSDPVHAGRRLALGILIDPQQDAVLLSIRLGFRGIESQSDAHSRFAYIEYLGAALRLDRETTTLTRATLFGVESNTPATPVAPGFTQLLRVQYLDDSHDLDRRVRQVELVFGRGGALGGDRGVASLLPYAVVGPIWNDGAAKLRGSIGLRLLVAGSAGESLQWRATWEEDLVHDRPVRRRTEAELWFRATRHLGIALAMSGTEHDAVGLAGLRLSFRF